MNDLDMYLEKDEKILWQGIKQRKSAMFTVWALLLPFLFMFVSAFTLFPCFMLKQFGVFETYIIPSIIYTVVIGLLVWYCVECVKLLDQNLYVITNKKLIKKVVNPVDTQIKTILLSKVSDIKLHIGFLDRKFGCASLIFYVYGNEGTEMCEIEDYKNAFQICRKVWQEARDKDSTTK